MAEVLKIPRLPSLPLKLGQNEVFADHTEPDAEVALALVFVQLLIRSNERQLNNVLHSVDIGQSMRSVSEQYSLILPHNHLIGIEVATPNSLNRLLLHSKTCQKKAKSC
jgi:hypothetical protein